MSIQSKAYERHGPEILAFLARRLWSRQDAEDLCQETFVRILQAEGKLRDRRKLRPYLYRIANNLLLNHIRRPKVVVTESSLGRGEDLAAHSDHQRESPVAAVEWSELKERLQELLLELPEQQKTAFKLGVLERRPYADIARLTGWSLAKVKVNVYRARKQLMAGLREFRP
jgi:RNA polymerase sigma-70 factor (ECF subfamily)